MTENKKPHPLAAYISSEIHGEDEEIQVYGSSVQEDGKSVYIEGSHSERGEFWAVIEVAGFGLILDDDLDDADVEIRRQSDV